MAVTDTVVQVEKRRNARCAIDFFVEEHCGTHTYLHPAIDLSADGIYILAHESREAIDASLLLALSFTLPTGLEVQTMGRIVHVDDRRGQLGLRIAFEGLSEGTRGLIRCFVDAHLRAA
jgi:hypothetical protein